MKHTPVEKPQPEPMEEAETDDDGSLSFIDIFI